MCIFTVLHRYKRRLLYPWEQPGSEVRGSEHTKRRHDTIYQTIDYVFHFVLKLKQTVPKYWEVGQIK